MPLALVLQRPEWNGDVVYATASVGVRRVPLALNAPPIYIGIPSSSGGNLAKGGDADVDA